MKNYTPLALAFVAAALLSACSGDDGYADRLRGISAPASEGLPTPDYSTAHIAPTSPVVAPTPTLAIVAPTPAPAPTAAPSVTPVAIPAPPPDVPVCYIGADGKLLNPDGSACVFRGRP